MAFTVDDVQDLIRLLAQHPEWRAELRPLILGDEILGLPASMRELSAAQTRTEAALDRLTGRVDELAAAQARTEARVEELAAAQLRTEMRLEELTAAQSRTEMRLEELTAAQSRTEAALQDLAADHKRVADRLGRLVGSTLELRFRSHAPAYLSDHVLKARVVALADVGGDDALLEGRLTDREHAEISRLDLIVKGVARYDGGRDVLLGVEVSAEIRSADVLRAKERAQLLEKLGLPTFAVVGGERIGSVARKSAESAGVIVRLIDSD